MPRGGLTINQAGALASVEAPVNHLAEMEEKPVMYAHTRPPGTPQTNRQHEALLLKCYDSKDDGQARFTAHTAFDDPTSPPDAAPRESIEVRALVFFAPEKNDAKQATAITRGPAT